MASRGVGTCVRVAAATAAAAAGATAYLTELRPRLLRWGATDQEVDGSLPGDERIAAPRYRSTRAIDIDAPAAEVWPWLAQIGQDRGGLYSYDWLENLVGLGFHSADRVHEEWQLHEGDVVKLAPDERGGIGLTVLGLEPPHVMVLGSPGGPDDSFEAGMPYQTWAFVLSDTAPGRCRLVVRLRADFEPTLLALVVDKWLLEPVHFVMERRMLHGIKERAEQAQAERLRRPIRAPRSARGRAPSAGEMPGEGEGEGVA